MSELALTASESMEGTHDAKQDILDEIKDQMNEISQGNGDMSDGINVNIEGKTIDITSPAGTLVLDDFMQKLSTIDQSNAQVVASEKTTKKNVDGLLR